MHGAKRWLVFPPGTAPDALFASLSPLTPPMREWVRDELPQLSAGGFPADCLQA